MSDEMTAKSLLKPKTGRSLTAAFLIIEFLFYIEIFFWTFSGKTVPDVRYIGVCLCFLASAVNAAVKRSRESLFLVCAMAFTVAADWFLVVLDDRYALSVAIFTGAQAFHFLRIFSVREAGFKKSLFIRLCVFGASLPLLRFEDPLIYLGANYIFNLAANAFDSACGIKKDRRFAMLTVGLVLFILCDVSVGLNGMRETFGLPDRIADLAATMIWIWYLPSQVLIVLSGIRE